jgi:hypothetical protein
MRFLTPVVFAWLLLSAPCGAVDAPQPVRVLIDGVISTYVDAGGKAQTEKGIYEADLDPALLTDRMAYHVKLRAFNDDRLLVESEMEMIGGVTATINGANHFRAEHGKPLVVGTESVSFLVAIDAAGMPPTGYEAPVFTPHQQAALAVAQRVAFGDLTFRIYMPNADRYELEMFSQQIPAGHLEFRQDLFLPLLVRPERPAEDVLGSIQGRISTPDVNVTPPPGHGIAVRPDGTLQLR